MGTCRGQGLPYWGGNFSNRRAVRLRGTHEIFVDVDTERPQQNFFYGPQPEAVRALPVALGAVVYQVLELFCQNRASGFFTNTRDLWAARLS